ncbi:MAG TPA: glycosyl hydrolase family 18 protein [Tepidisphaeraceae bacterium]
MTTGELVRNGAMEGVVAAADWARGASWQSGSLGHTNYHGGAGYAFNGTATGSYIHNTSGAAGEMYQELTIPVGTVNPTLQFWTKITTEETSTTTAFDTMQVQVLDTSGTVLSTVASFSNLNAGSTAGPYTATGKYNLNTFSMSPFVGQTVRINFKVTTDGARGTMFRVDDVSLAPPVPVVPGTSKQVVGYLPDYQNTKFGQLDYNYLTHINYFSVAFASGGLITEPSAAFSSRLDSIVAAAHAKGVGVSITTGPSQPYAAMAASASARTNFVASLLTYVNKHNLDGVDIDWEPPAKGGDQVNYGLLIDDLYATFNPLGKKITAAVNPWTKEIPVDASKKMSWINVMCYDFDYANHSTYAAATDGMLQWTYYGVAKDKLVMGVPFYGRYGTSWGDTHSKTYNTIVNDYKSLNNGVYPPFEMDSYKDAANNTTYFNGVTTIAKKTAFVRDNSYGGVFTWELGQDSWDTSAKYDQYSLLPVMYSIMRPPAWLTPASGSTFDLVNGNFYMHTGTATLASAVSPNTTNVTVRSNARLISNIQQKFGNLLIQNAGDFTVNAGGNKMLTVNTLSIAAGGKMDLRDNDIVINSGNFAAIQSLVMQGYRDAVDSSATGIISTSSQTMAGHPILALFDNAQMHVGQFPFGSGNTVAANAICGKFTYIGDADFNGMVTPDDYGAIDSNLGRTNLNAGAAWFAGDWNFDGSVTPDDYMAIDANLGMGQSNPLAAESSSSQPVVAVMQAPAPLAARQDENLLTSSDSLLL